MTAIVEARHLQKTYGKIRAVDDVSFEIKEGEIFGLLGPNGAGKTTTIRMLSGLTDPDKGEARVDGCDVVQDPVGAKQRLGVVPENSNLYGELTALENLVYMAQLYGVSKAQWKPRSEELLKRFGLFLPLTYCVDLFRFCLLGQKSFLNPYLDLAALIVFSLILFILINMTFKRRLREQY